MHWLADAPLSQVYVDDMDTAVINMPLSLKYALKLTDGKAAVGFTAATGSMWQNHDILEWRFQACVLTLSSCSTPCCSSLPALRLRLDESLRRCHRHPGGKWRGDSSPMRSACSLLQVPAHDNTRRSLKQEYSADPEVDCPPGLISRSQCLQV